MMNMESQNAPGTSNPRLFGSANPQKILILILNRWLVYLLALILCGTGAFLYLKYTIPSYNVSTTILIEEEEPTPTEDILQGFAVRPGIQNLDNQLVIISSYSLIRKVVEELPFEIDVYKKGFLSERSFYPEIPLRIEPGPGGLPYDVDFMFRYSEGNEFKIATANNHSLELDTLIAFGQPIRYGNHSFTIYAKPELDDVYETGEKIFIRFFNKEMLTQRFLNRLQVELAARDGSIVRLSVEGTNRAKNADFLNKLTDVYINDNLDKKNAEAKRIENFIDKQLEGVSDSLRITEDQLQEFRSRNQIMDVSAQAQQIIDQAVVLENEKARLNLEGDYYRYLNEYLSSDRNDKAPIAPSSMGITDPMLSSLMRELADLQAEYFSSGVGERNPQQSQLELRIMNTKNSIKETLTGVMLTNNLAIDENERQINRLNARASQLPEKERQLLGFERRFNLNNELYTYLMQRRAEAQIQSASNTPDNVLVDPARSMGLVAPVASFVYIFAFALAIGLPTIVILLGNVLQNKIATEEDLNFVKDSPVIGHFPHSRLSYNTVVLTEPNSKISESFRSLRTRLEFFITDVSCPLLVISSSMPGEGKSFTAINLASAYSLAGKKTLLLGFDLRKPTISSSFEIDNETGITSYLIGKKKLKEVVHKTDYDNLFIIPSGPIPPNPGELCSSPKISEMLDTLKNEYEMIIIDSPPIGVVSDIYSIARMADTLLLMVRHNYTKKHVLRATLSELKLNGLSGIGLLMNDIRTKGSSYQYAYKYKYDSNVKRSKLQRLRAIFTSNE